MKKALLFFPLLCCACSSIIDGRSQQITINTNPAGASCALIRQDIPIATINPTPGSAYIEKTKYDILIKCKKAGYQEATYMNHSGSAGATWGNIVAGGVIGWGVDSATGADNKYDSPRKYYATQKIIQSILLKDNPDLNITARQNSDTYIDMKLNC